MVFTAFAGFCVLVMNTIGFKRPFNKGLKIIVVLNLSFILLLVFRAFFGAAFMDEAYNVAQAYRLIQGNTFLVDVWELTQTGDVFMFPFFFVYHKIKTVSALPD